jgi:hypothetical protein
MAITTSLPMILWLGELAPYMIQLTLKTIMNIKFATTIVHVEKN